MELFLSAGDFNSQAFLLDPIPMWYMGRISVSICVCVCVRLCVSVFPVFFLSDIRSPLLVYRSSSKLLKDIEYIHTSILRKIHTDSFHNKNSSEK